MQSVIRKATAVIDYSNYYPLRHEMTKNNLSLTNRNNILKIGQICPK